GAPASPARPRPPARSRPSSPGAAACPASTNRRTAPIPAAPAPITATSTSDASPVMRDLAATLSVQNRSLRGTQRRSNLGEGGCSGTRSLRRACNDRVCAMRLGDFQVLSFDCYGTLIDWESGIWTALQPLLAKAAGGLSRETALSAFARHES